MKTFRRFIQILWVALKYAILPELKLTRGRKVPRPVRLRLALQELGATWVKLGQALAMRFDLLAPSYCQELFHLFNRMAPFPYAAVREIITTELGRDVSQLFSSFNPEPFAAASIGQVHRATLPSGDEVAVKVQRPGIEALVASDLRLMYRFCFIPDLLRLFGGTRTRVVVDEFAGWLNDELDYTTEAMNAYTIRENARMDPIEYNPKVWLAYSTKRVLTLEFIEGIPVSDILTELRRDRNACVARMRVEGYDLDRVASNSVWNLLNQVYVIGLFHADLHPANLLILPGNRVGYVDFGITGRLPSNARESLIVFARSLLTGDAERAIVELTRWVSPSSRTSQADAIDEFKALARGFMFELRATRQSRQALAARYQVALLNAVRRHQMRVDPTIISYVKTVITLDSVTSELSPDLDLVTLEMRFFSALTLDMTRDFLRPAELVNVVMNYRYRIDRALDFVERVAAEERTVSDILATTRAWIERLALVGVAGVIAVWLVERFKGHTRGIFSTNAGFVLVVVGGIFLLAILRQTRKLPDTGTGRRQRRKLQRRNGMLTEHPWPPQEIAPSPPNGSATAPSDRPSSARVRS